MPRAIRTIGELAAARRIADSLGPVRHQSPPDSPRTLYIGPGAFLEAFLKALPGRRRYAFELRDPTWHSAEIYAILRRHRAAFCIFEIAGFRSGFEVTADFTYVRLHGPEGAYQGSYSEAALREWAGRIREWQDKLRAIYIYFDNDQAGYAPKNALELAKLTA